MHAHILSIKDSVYNSNLSGWMLPSLGGGQRCSRRWHISRGDSRPERASLGGSGASSLTGSRISFAIRTNEE